MKYIPVALCFLVFSLIGCQPSTDQISEQVKVLLQSKLNSDPELKPYNIAVSKIDVIHDEGKRYQGVADLVMKEKHHSITLKILTDGRKVMYEADPTAFAFVAQQALVNVMDQMAPLGGLTQSDGTKAGWSDIQLAAFTGGCVESIVQPAKQDYAAAAARAGNASPKPFPEDLFRSSAGQMCSCLSRRTAETWSFGDFMLNQAAYSRSMLQEAMTGAKCKPEGIIGAVLAHLERGPAKERTLHEKEVADDATSAITSEPAKGSTKASATEPVKQPVTQIAATIAKYSLCKGSDEAICAETDKGTFTANAFSLDGSQKALLTASLIKKVPVCFKGLEPVEAGLRSFESASPNCD